MSRFLPISRLLLTIVATIGCFYFSIVLATNTEALLSEVSVRQEVVFAERGQYEYIAPICDSLGCYHSNHIEVWSGGERPAKAFYQVIYIKTDGSSRTESSFDSSYAWDWTAPRDFSTTTL